ncbi:endonuclease [Flavobacterium sp. U410]
MKKITLLLTLLAQLGFAQIPTGYYDHATGTGYTLKNQLKEIINTDAEGFANEYIHQPHVYNDFDAFTAANDLDNYYENDGTILDIYSENPLSTDPYNYTPVIDECGEYNGEGQCYNKEHTIPQSIFSQNEPMRGDAFHLYPTDGRVNGFRSNYPFGYVGSNLVSQNGITNPTMNGSKLGNNINTGLFLYSGTVFEPIDEFKGDIARSYFYFVTRYQDEIPGWNSYAMFNGTTTQGITDGFLYTLIDWHIKDPVSQREIDRNNNTYTYQNNRNPFIDHPEYVQAIWSSHYAAIEALAAQNFSINSVSIYPNPSTNGTFTIESATQLTKVTVYTINGQIAQEIKSPQGAAFQINNLAKGFYLIQLETESASTIQKVIVN